MTRYTPYFCEENAWFALKESGLEQGHAVFIVSLGEGVAIWAQAASARDDGLTMWDYHVVALGQRDGRWCVIDPDCTAGRELPLDSWVAASFPLAGVLPPEIEPRFRIVPSQKLFAEFHTDRSHMRGPDGAWLADPPPWPPLSESSNLADYLRPDETITLKRLLEEFADG